MANPIMAALSSEEIVHASALATVTTNFLVVPNGFRHNQNIIALASVGKVQKTKSTYPGLLVIASGLFLVAAAAYFSKDGNGAHLPAALLGVAFVVAYLGSQRASISFFVGYEVVSSPSGTLREAASLVKVVERLRAGDERYSASLIEMSGKALTEAAQSS